MVTLNQAAWVLLPILFAIHCIRHFTRGLRVTKRIPGVRCAFGPLSFWGAVLGTRWWNPGLDYMWQRRKDLYANYGTDTISVVPVVSGTPFLMTANLEVARQIVAGGTKSSFYKPESVSMALLLWGQNLAAAEGEHWKRHRRIMNPAFNPVTYALVWKETMRTYYDMMKTEGWYSQDEVHIPSIQDPMFKFAFFIIAACGFGLPFDWFDPPRSSKGFSIQQSLRIILDHTMFQVLCPSWAYHIPLKIIQAVKEARSTLDTFMHEQVSLRRNEMRSQLSLGVESDAVRKDVFSRLTRACEQEEAKLSLSDQELIGNVFVMLFAGHETTANTLAVVMGFLGIYQDAQEEAYQQIMEVCGDRDPTFEDYPKLDKVLACFLEALRLFPAGSLMIRHTLEDTTLVVPDTHGGQGEEHLLLRKGTQVVVDVIGLQYNPRYFPDPERYNPSRWYAGADKSKPLDGFTAFSFGPRVCIGQNFSKTEGVCYLALLLRDWKLDIKLNPGETREQYRERVMQAHFKMTLSAYNIPIMMTKRARA